MIRMFHCFPSQDRNFKFRYPFLVALSHVGHCLLHHRFSGFPARLCLCLLFSAAAVTHPNCAGSVSVLNQERQKPISLESPLKGWSVGCRFHSFLSLYPLREKSEDKPNCASFEEGVLWILV